MKQILGLIGAALCLLLAACASPAPAAPTATPAPPSPTPAPLKSGTMRVGFSSEADAGDVPSLMAHELLKQEGYTVETTFFTTADLEVAALSQGQLDISNGSTRTHWSAVANGAGIRTVMEQVAILWSIKTKPDIKNCNDLNGRRYAISSTGSLNAALTNAYLQQNCPGTKPEFVVIANSVSRSSALIAGQVDATNLELADVLEVEQKAPGQFSTLVDFGKTLPKLKSTGIHVNRDFAQKHPDMVRDYLRAVLTLHRRIRENSDLLKAAFVKYLSMDTTTANKIATAYLERGAWDVNGGMSADAIPYSVGFFANSGGVPKELKADSVSDLTYLNAVLDELGRK